MLYASLRDKYNLAIAPSDSYNLAIAPSDSDSYSLIKARLITKSIWAPTVFISVAEILKALQLTGNL